MNNNKCLKNGVNKVFIKSFFVIAIVFSLFFSGANATFAQTKTAAKMVTVKWSADGIKALGSMDHSSFIRNIVMKKVETYAKRNNIKLITARVVRSMRE